MMGALALACVALPAAAQDVDAEPNYGTVELAAGFTPDPHRVNLQSGGDIDASGIGSPCNGYISNAPDVRLVYASGNYPLIISVQSGVDTTLVVNAPDGEWYCDDDGGNIGTNPSVRFDNAMSGRYEIWVGTYGSASLAPAQLQISELYSQ
jgi:hypothetical protein